jgi:hypothetical protein
VALRLPPANGWDPSGIEEGDGRFIYPTGGGADRRWRFAYHRLMAEIPPGSKDFLVVAAGLPVLK